LKIISLDMLERLRYASSMEKKKRPTDISQLAYQIVQEATQEVKEEPTLPPIKEKNPAAVALGHLGGLKGGPARAKKLSAKKRKEIARKAAISRWGKNNP
jgi:hypothetical protein